MNFYDHLHLIKNEIPFASVKVNHGYWERLVRAETLQRSGISDPVLLDRRLGQPFLFESGYVAEMKAALAYLTSQTGNVSVSATPYSWPACRRIEGTPAAGFAQTMKVISEHVPAQFANSDGLLWKSAVLDGSFPALIEALRTRNITIIGPSWIEHFAAFAKLNGAKFIRIHPSAARGTRQEFLEELKRQHDATAKTIYMLVAGSYSPWLAWKIHENLQDASVLDMGGVMNICHLPSLKRNNWSRVQRQHVAKTIETINPDWIGDARFHDAELMTKDERLNAWHEFREGIITLVARTAQIPLRRQSVESIDCPDMERKGFISFVENKPHPLDRVAEFLERSRGENHWTNFGPLNRALESVIGEITRLNPAKFCVGTSSGTTALYALAGLEAAKKGRPLKWVVSAYTFPCQRTGPLHDALIVDCDASGMLDLEAVSHLDESAWDGLIVTNLFGSQPDLKRFQEFAAARGKRLLIDGATALLGVARDDPITPNEAISFHHTKPWGFGEGGCAIVDAADAELLRSIINFGLTQSDSVWPYAFNGKLSEVAAASILERLERLPNWSFFYERQRRRLLELASQYELPLLTKTNPNSISSSIPVLAPRPVSLEQLSEQRFKVQKYYRPLRPGFPVADDIFSRIVNIPCHPGMSAISSGEIEAFFEKLKNLA